MKSTLEQLYNGELYPAENFVPQSPEYRSLYAEFTKNANKFREKVHAIDPNWKDTFDCLLGDQACLNAIALEEMFYFAFKLGVSLVVECVNPSSVSA